MKFENIEVSGIENITFERKTKWTRDGSDNGCVWKSAGDVEAKTHGEMMFIVNKLKEDHRYRMWVHFDTLNIVRKVCKK
jgi:hypothetical protein